MDENGAKSGWSQPLVVSMSRGAANKTNFLKEILKFTFSQISTRTIDFLDEHRGGK